MTPSQATENSKKKKTEAAVSN
jgi:tubulin polyglutamylase TTLL6/13